AYCIDESNYSDRSHHAHVAIKINHPTISKSLVTPPVPMNDKDTPALQTADLIACILKDWLLEWLCRWTQLKDIALHNRWIAALSSRNKQLVVGTEAIYEMAKTFKRNPDRGKELFASLKTFTDLGIPCPRPNPNILRSEAELALSSSQQQVNIFLNAEDYQNMQQEVDKLS